LFLAEGSCSFENAKKGNWLVSLSMTKKNLVSFVKKEFESFFGCQFSVLEDGTKITTSDKGLFLWLAENFYTRNKLKKIPKFVYNSDKDFQRMFRLKIKK